jgi:hypothetical protein
LDLFGIRSWGFEICLEFGAWCLGFGIYLNITLRRDRTYILQKSFPTCIISNYFIYFGFEIKPKSPKAMKTIAFCALTGAFSLFFVFGSYAQIGIGTTTPNASSILDVSSTTKGMLVPSMTKLQRNAITSPATGLIIFQTDDTTGIYYNAGTPAVKSWKLVGNNAGQWVNNGASIYYNGGNVGIGNTNPQAKLHVGGDALINGLTVGKSTSPNSENTAFGDHALYFNDAAGNTAVGYYTLYAHEEGNYNTAIGDRAMRYDSAGSYNTASGFQSLYSNRSGISNTTMGYRSLYSNLNGGENVAGGVSAMHYNTTGSTNSAYGYRALFSNQTGYSNVAIGVRALYKNTTKSNLVAVGDSALYNNWTDIISPTYSKNNVAVGSKALYSNTTGYNNAGCGFQALYSNTLGYQNSAFGCLALFSNTTGYRNAAFGNVALSSNHYGDDNTAIGHSALLASLNASDNTAVGSSSLMENITGEQNTAVGNGALKENISGNINTSIGYVALYSHKQNDGNTAIGSYAMYSDTSGVNNTAIGYRALIYNTDRSNLVAVGDSALYYNGEDVSESYHATKNTAVGSAAMLSNTFGYYNTAVGYLSLYTNEGGKSNTAVGAWSLLYNVSGTNNTATGVAALFDLTSGIGNTACGSYAGKDRSLLNNCTFIGREAFSVSEDITNSTALGSLSTVNASQQVRIGNSLVTSIGGYVGWTNISDERYKTHVQEDVAGLEFIMKLRPVTYRLDIDNLSAALAEDRENNREGESSSEAYKAILKESKNNKAKITYTGFIAQEVEQAATSVGFNFSGIDKSAVENGGPYGLRYAEFVVPLVQAVQDQQQMIAEQEAKITAQQRQIDELIIKMGKMEGLNKVQ